MTLPLGATEEMVSGSLKLQQALQAGEVTFPSGLLARGHGDLLYVDEVNLLPDHLVDLLLDVAASGINHVERDGIGHRHDAEFVLVGTMNPDKGELRPRLLDRFGLVAVVQEQFTLEKRSEIVRRRVAFDSDPDAIELVLMPISHSRLRPFNLNAKMLEYKCLAIWVGMVYYISASGITISTVFNQP